MGTYSSQYTHLYSVTEESRPYDLLIARARACVLAFPLWFAACTTCDETSRLADETRRIFICSKLRRTPLRSLANLMKSRKTDGAVIKHFLFGQITDPSRFVITGNTARRSRHRSRCTTPLCSY